MDWHRDTSPALPVRFPASTGRSARISPPSAAPAGLSFEEFRSRYGLLTALWSVGFGLVVAWIGPDRFNTIRFAIAFLTAALAHIAFADRTSNHMETRR
jgi:hypothetical protein